MKRQTKLKLILLGISITFSAFFAELAIRLFMPQNLSGSWRITTNSGLQANKSSGTSQHQSGERKVDYSFYPPHLRDTQIDPTRKNILCLGDSFTFGWLLNKQDTYIAHLQKYADKAMPSQYNFLNAACGGWGTSDYLKYLEEYGEQIKPDTILVFLNTDDIGRSFKHPHYTFGPNKTLIKSQNAPQHQNNFLKTSATYQLLLEHSHLIQLLRKSLLFITHDMAFKGNNNSSYYGPYSDDLKKTRNESIELGQELFKKMKQWADTHHAKLLIVTTGWHRIGQINKESTEPTKAFLSQAGTFFENNSIAYADITPQVTSVRFPDKNKYVILLDSHPNELGAKLIAEMAWKQFIMKELQSE